MTYLYSCIIGLALAGSLLVWEGRPQESLQDAQSATVAYAPSNDREAWAVALLSRLGNTQPSASTVAFVVEWTLAEDSGDGALSRGNPLNTTMPSAAETQTINSDGVKGYSGMDTGLDATVATITNGLYGDVLAGLQTNDPARAKAGLFASPWASSHYGYGAGWPVVAPEPSTPSSCPVNPCWQSGSGYGAGHPGIDLGATLGQPVYATMDGTVQTSQTWPCGNGVMITSGDTQTLVCHLSAFTVADGATVRAGEQVGQAGDSGQAYGVHIHFEIRVGGVNVDPSGVLIQ